MSQPDEVPKTQPPSWAIKIGVVILTALIVGFVLPILIFIGKGLWRLALA